MCHRCGRTGPKKGSKPSKGNEKWRELNRLEQEWILKRATLESYVRTTN